MGLHPSAYRASRPGHLGNPTNTNAGWVAYPVPSRALIMFVRFFVQDTLLVPNMWAAHHDPTVYEKPFEFMPERFLQHHSGQLKKKDTTVPFGLGRYWYMQSDVRIHQKRPSLQRYGGSRTSDLRVETKDSTASATL